MVVYGISMDHGFYSGLQTSGKHTHKVSKEKKNIWLLNMLPTPGLEKSSVLPVLGRFLSLKTDFVLNRKQKNRSIKVRFFPSYSQ